MVIYDSIATILRQMILLGIFAPYERSFRASFLKAFSVFMRFRNETWQVLVPAGFLLIIDHVEFHLKDLWPQLP